MLNHLHRYPQVVTSHLVNISNIQQQLCFFCCQDLFLMFPPQVTRASHPGTFLLCVQERRRDKERKEPQHRDEVPLTISNDPLGWLGFEPTLPPFWMISEMAHKKHFRYQSHIWIDIFWATRMGLKRLYNVIHTLWESIWAIGCGSKLLNPQNGNRPIFLGSIGLPW